MKIILTLSLALVLVGPTLPRKVTSVKKDASEIKFEPITPEGKKERISRQSSPDYTQAAGNVKYQYQLLPLTSVLGHTGGQVETAGIGQQYVTQLGDNYQNLQQKQQEVILAALRAAKQPKAPVYHASPLQPYGALLKDSAGLQYEDKTVLVTPKTVQTQQFLDQSGAQEATGSQVYYTGSDDLEKISNSVIQEPKHATVIFKSDHHHHLHHPDVEPKNYAAKYQFGYQVRDPKHGTYFGHAEARDGHHTKGHYHVLLPDGRLQNVQYWADLSGYHAQVSYNSAARHPVTHHH